MVTINTIDAGLSAIHLLSPSNLWIVWRQSGRGARALPEPWKEHVMQVSIVDAFTRTPGAGNRAGVVLDAAGLDTGAMQRIAAAV
ncbi:MAG: PhzF family phenazine biosynthesis protein, partial [Hyalangium sp.]|uniref:PhzF family phenazine biosynthesis protein n=1 Tax=Hyalangium sp. TaxID=2028555 RepID=UPI003899E194